MRCRRRASLVEAFRFDGSEAAFQAALAIPRSTLARLADGGDVPTPVGVRTVRKGQWVTRDAATDVVRVYDHGAFHADHEVVA